MKRIQSHKLPNTQGFTLVELMIAMLIGIILMLGIATIFTNTTNNIRLQRGIANIQENGRLAIDLMTGDISGAGSQYCSAINIQLAQDGFTPQRPILSTITAPRTVNGNDDLITSYTTTNNQTTGGIFYGLLGVTNTPNPAATAYLISGRYLIQGHNCVGGTCTPLLTSAGSARTESGATAANNVPGNAVGQRVPGTDVLTVRTLVGNGASIASSIANGYNLAPNSLARLGLDAVPTARLQNRLVMIADCNQAAIYQGTFAGNTVTLIAAPSGANTAFSAANNARVFDMENQWLTVTYFLQFVADPNNAARVIPALMRRENGRALEEIARGVERLDFRYAVNAPAGAGINPENNVIWLTADLVNNRNGGAIPCPAVATGTTETECLWRGVTAVEVGMSLNTVDAVANNDDRQTYAMENERNVAVADRQLHREFRFVVPIKSWAR
jgi:type IV pilus assembly protein PilW